MFPSDTDSVQLLAEEVDAIDSPMAGGAPPPPPSPPPPSKRPSRLELPPPGSEMKQPSLEDNWVVLDLSYGIPLFDADLNGAVMERIVGGGRGLAKAASLQRLSTASAETSAALLDFIR
jgi:FAM91 C-terminus